MKRTNPRAAQSPADFRVLARLISGVLTHPLTPESIQMGLAEALSNMTNTEAMDAPETIGSILYHHAKRQ